MKGKYILAVAISMALLAGASSCCKKQEKEIANLKSQIEQLQKDNAAIKAESDKIKADLDAKVQALTEENTKLSSENSELKKKIEALSKPAAKKKRK